MMANDKRPAAIFVVGTGRSGTNFLAQKLNCYANIYDPWHGSENHVIREEVTMQALRHEGLSESAECYYLNLKGCLHEHRILLDQSHPLLFHARELVSLFEGRARFLFVDRNIFAVVNSAVKHKGVLKWKNKARFDSSIPFPNKFLGLRSRANTWLYSDAIAYTLRYLSAKQQYLVIRQSFPGLVDILNYDDLVRAPEDTIADLFRGDMAGWLGERVRNNVISSTESINKYEQELSNADRQEVVKGINLFKKMNPDSVEVIKSLESLFHEF